MDGYAGRDGPSRGIHDDLFARTLYFSDERDSFAIISCDLCWISQQLVSSTQNILSQKGAEASQLMFCATHTHSGPAVVDLLSPLNDKNLSYLRELPKHIADSVIDAQYEARPARIEVSRSEADLSFNRRISNGQVDRSITIISFVSADHEPIAKLVNYACHGTVLGENNRFISADFPGSLTSLIESAESRNFACVYLNGACGDVNPRTCRGYDCSGSFDDVASMGKALAALCTSSKNSKWIGTGEGVNFRRLRIGPFPPLGMEIELSVARVGELALVGVPGEVFAETGLAMKGNSQASQVLVVGYANGYQGYFPTADAFTRGDYETSPLCWVDSSAESELRRALALLELSD